MVPCRGIMANSTVRTIVSVHRGTGSCFARKPQYRSTRYIQRLPQVMPSRPSAGGILHPQQPFSGVRADLTALPARSRHGDKKESLQAFYLAISDEDLPAAIDTTKFDGGKTELVKTKKWSSPELGLRSVENYVWCTRNSQALRRIRSRVSRGLCRRPRMVKIKSTRLIASALHVPELFLPVISTRH